MTLTLGIAPLASGAPQTANYTLDGPKNKILLTPFPRRVRALFGGETILDSEDAILLHESDIYPVLYVPIAHLSYTFLHKTDHSTHCPYKGDASYWTVSVGDSEAENAVWGYETPLDAMRWLATYVAIDWGAMDQWFDEDDEVFGHIRCPFHRVDARPTSRRYQVRIGDTIVAETTRAFIVSETGFENRVYIPAADVRVEEFSTSSTTTHCPHKGDSVYWSHDPTGVSDVAWSYPTPLEEATRVAGHWSFDGPGVTVERVTSGK